jgi:formamidopyrimidine-DNA glycosylase
MPELPEVETVVRTLRAAVLGARITSVRHASSRISRPNPRGWKSALAERTIDTISRRGKYIIFSLRPGGLLVVHLRMTGRFRLYPADAKRGAHDRLILTVEEGPLESRALLTLVDARQFARADFIAEGQARQHPGIAKLGVEADQISETELRRVLANSHRPIKSLLLDQTALAGLGNIYADESLFAAGIHPLAPSDLIDRGQVRRLRLSMKRILNAAIEACGTTFDTFSDLSGKPGGFAPYLNVYSRTGQPCRVCGAAIDRIVLSGRSAHFCPHCQQAMPQNI